MLTFIPPWLRCSLLLAVFAAAFSLGIWRLKKIAAKEGIDANTRDILEMIGVYIRLQMARIKVHRSMSSIPRGKAIGLVCAGFVLGWVMRDAWQFHHTYVLNDVRVIQKHDAQRFLFAFDDTHQPFAVTFCSDYTPAFDAGMTLKLLVYEDHGECWSISHRKLGYIIARNAEGRIINTNGE